MSPRLPVRRFTTAQDKATAVGHGIDCVTDQVGQDLPDLAFKTKCRPDCALAHLHNDVGIEQPSLIERQGFLKQLRAGYEGRAGRLLAEAKRLVVIADTRRSSRSASARY